MLLVVIRRLMEFDFRKYVFMVLGACCVLMNEISVAQVTCSSVGSFGAAFMTDYFNNRFLMIDGWSLQCFHCLSF